MESPFQIYKQSFDKDEYFDLLIRQLEEQEKIQQIKQEIIKELENQIVLDIKDIDIGKYIAL